MSHFRRHAKCLFDMKRSARVAHTMARRAQTMGGQGDPGYDRTGASRLVFGTGCLGLALLAADLVFNGT